MTERLNRWRALGLESDSIRLEAIADAYDDLSLWEPGKRGYAAAVKRFLDVVAVVLDREGAEFEAASAAGPGPAHSSGGRPGPTCPQPDHPTPPAA